MKTILAVVFALILTGFFFFPATAHAACTAPAAPDGSKYWNSVSGNFDFCIGSSWVPGYNTAIAGNPVCSSTGQIEYDAASEQYRMCNGANWRNLCDIDASFNTCVTAPTSYTTPGYYTYTVPASCPGILIDAYGAGGGGSNDRGASSGGGGSVVIRQSNGSLLAAGGGGGGGGGKEFGVSHKGGGGGHGITFSMTLSAGDVLDIYVGGGGLASSSDNGTNGGVYNGGTQPITGQGVQTSTNGVFWTSRTSAMGTSVINEIGYNGSNLLAVVGPSGKLATSSNGSSWTIQSSAATAFGLGTVTINTIAYGGGQWIAAGNSGNLATSPDGITWTARTSGFGTTAINDVAYNGSNLWVAAGASGTLTTSPDGITWTARTSGFGTNNINAVAYGGGKWVAAGNSGNLATSPDGITWTARTSGFGTTAINDVAYNGSNLWVAAGASGTLTTSPDGITWTARTSGFGTNNIYGVAYGNSLWMTGGINGELRTSSDGINWTKRYTASSTQSDINSLVYDAGNSQWVTGGESVAGGSYVGGVAGADRNSANYAVSLYGGGGGGGSDGGRGAGAIYGGSGGQGDDAAGGCGASTYGLGCSGSMGGGGGGYGDNVASGTTGGNAASGGPGNGGNEGAAGGNGKVVITPYGGPCKIGGGCAYTHKSIEYEGSKFKWCRNGVWAVIAE